MPANSHRLEVSFTKGPNDVDAALEMLLPLLKKRRTCIQAGGCIGIWPLRLSQVFDHVHAFELDPINYECLIHNADEENITPIHSALSYKAGETVGYRLDEGERQNPGATYVINEGDVPTVKIDDLGLDDVDLIYLDIEGSESLALLGATETIKRCKPIIGLEDKGHHIKQGNPDPVKYLIKQLDYRVHGKPSRLDVILVPNDE